MKSSDEFQLTQEDKDRYEKRISEIGFPLYFTYRIKHQIRRSPV